MRWKGIIVTPISEIIEYSRYYISLSSTNGSEQIPSGPLVSDFMKMPTGKVGQFLSMLLFEDRDKLAGLPIDLQNMQDFSSEMLLHSQQERIRYGPTEQALMECKVDLADGLRLMWIRYFTADSQGTRRKTG